MAYYATDGDTQNDPHFERLVSCVRSSWERSRKYRELNQLLIDAAMGQYYPRAIGPVPETPLNLLWMTHRAMSRWLSMRDPKVMANTSVPEFKSFAEDAEIAVNKTIKEANFGKIVSQVIDQSLYSIGALSITADYVGDSKGMRQKIVMRNVPFPNLVWDVGVLDIDESDYIGEKMNKNLVDVKENPLFDERARMQVEASSMSHRTTEDVANWQSAAGSFKTDLYDYVELYQVHDRKSNRLYVWPVDQPHLKLMDMEWNGPVHGPIRLLHFGTPPGHPYPVAPMQNWHRLARAQNVLLAKVLQQAQTAKGLMLYTSASKDEAEDIVKSTDLNSVLQEHGSVRYTNIGGADPGTVAMQEKARKDYSYAVGGLEVLLGLGTQAPTLGQERMLSENATASMQDMAEEVYRFIRDAVNDIYWFNIRDPETHDEITKPIGKTGLTYGVKWTPGKREFILSSGMQFEIDVEPFSYRSRTPDGRLADFLGALQMLQAWRPDMAAQGMSIDMEAVFKTIAKYKDLPELYDSVILNQDPEDLAKLMGPREGQTPMDAGGPKRYIRESRSDGAGEKQELMRMMSQGGRDKEMSVA